MKQGTKGRFAIYWEDVTQKGPAYFVRSRVKKYKSLRGLYNLFKKDHVIIENIIFYIDKNDTVISDELLYNKTWEPFETELFKQLIPQADIIIDIGAHIGYYALIAAKHGKKQADIYAFEPDVTNFSLLTKNISANKYTNITAINSAIGEKNTTATLYINDENRGDHQLYNNGQKKQTSMVNLVTLDYYFKRLPLKSKKVSIIMDIQGYEVHAMQGMQSLLSLKDVTLFVEFLPMGLKLAGTSAKDFVSFLERYSFTTYIINENTKQMLPVTNKELLNLSSITDKPEVNLLCTKDPLIQKKLRKYLP